MQKKSNDLTGKSLADMLRTLGVDMAPPDHPIYSGAPSVIFGPPAQPDQGQDEQALPTEESQPEC